MTDNVMQQLQNYMMIKTIYFVLGSVHLHMVL